MKYRVAPTTEDVEIIRRQIQRIMRWDAEAFKRGESKPKQIIRTLRNATGDYLEYTDVLAAK